VERISRKPAAKPAMAKALLGNVLHMGNQQPINGKVKSELHISTGIQRTKLRINRFLGGGIQTYIDSTNSQRIKVVNPIMWQTQ
jgi:hypothetical protein